MFIPLEEINKINNERRFKKVMADLKGLDLWLKYVWGGTGTAWSLTERLAFLRNVEAIQRTEEAKTRTWLAIVGFILAVATLIVVRLI